MYCKGAPALLDEGEIVKPWAYFGLQLRSDARLAFYASNTEDRCHRNVSTRKLHSDVWTHIAVVVDKNKSRLYMNGELSSEKVFDITMLCPGKSSRSVQIVESPHPYKDNSDEHVIVEIPGARSYIVVFDPQVWKIEYNLPYVFLSYNFLVEDGGQL